MSIRVDVRDQYRHISDAELQQLAGGYTELTPEAQQALLAEMQARGFQEGIDTAQEVEAKAEAEAIVAAQGPAYFVVTDADQQMPTWFQVITPRQDLRFPDVCPVCGQTANTTYPVLAAQLSKATMSTRVRVQQLQYEVPHCQDCRRANIRAGLPTLLMIFGAVAVLAVLVGLWLGTGAAAAAVILSYLLGFNKIKSLARRGQGGIFMLDYDEKSIWFVIKNRAYAERFCELNEEHAIPRAVS